MIYIGNDIINVSRIKNNINNHGQKFLKKIYSKQEINYCINKRFPEIHFSGKFAAKEATLKAIYHYDDNIKIYIKDIEIINDSKYKPSVLIKNTIFKKINIQTSISHSNSYATAFTILYT